MTYDEMIEVIQAIKDDKPVEFRIKDRRADDEWHLGQVRISNPNFNTYDYRIKKVPRVRWIVEGTSVSGARCQWLFNNKEDAIKNCASANASLGGYYNHDFIMYEMVEKV